MEENRTPTGIEGLDKLLGGGIPENNSVLLSGGSGTGKTTFCLQFLMNGAINGEKGVYISTEQSKSELYRCAAGYDWNLKAFEVKGLLRLEYFDSLNSYDFNGWLHKLHKEFEPKRIVIDSLTTLSDGLIVTAGMGDGKDFSMVQVAETINPVSRTERVLTKSLVFRLLNELRSFPNTTTILTSELSENQEFLSADNISEFVCDGVIILKSLATGPTLNRTLEIKKMRYTKIDGGIHSYDLSEEGFVVE